MSDSVTAPDTPVSAHTSAGVGYLGALADVWRDVHQAPGGKEVLASHEEAYLVGKRLVVASSLYYSLRARHAPTAMHCLRVALWSSCWASVARVSDEDRDALEIAALLHDVGKVGVPDYILLKPGKLTTEEQLTMSRYRLYTHEIVAACCASTRVLAILAHQGAWYDGSQPGQVQSGKSLPLGARMLAIADAYDSMTTEHVYRRAMTRERAIAELYAHAGTQFDPDLVAEFTDLVESNLLDLEGPMVRRWLHELQPANMHGLLRDVTIASVQQVSPPPEQDLLREFHDQLLNSMHDGVFFVDNALRVLHWNRAAERITGIQAGAIVHRTFAPSLIGMADETGSPIPDERCPIAEVAHFGSQRLQRVMIRGRTGGACLVNLHVVPVYSKEVERKGVAVLLHDASSQANLEQRVQLLQERATRDSLTGLANRAEFERVFPDFVASHLQTKTPCSLLICDIDHFKRINDIYGHQAGDEALRTFGELLQSALGSGEWAARYGGEEFIVLFPHTTAARAVQWAEDLRRRLGTRPIREMGGQCLTASFGVTELQPGDTPETILRRADRALLQAKDAGRNRVVQLGSGWLDLPETTRERRSWWSRLISSGESEQLVVRHLVTDVPLRLVAEKLKGFVADHHAVVLEVLDNKLRLRLDGHNVLLLRRRSDRPVALELAIELQTYPPSSNSETARPRSLIRVEVRPVRKRDRRRMDLQARAGELLASLRAYLMAEEADAPHDVPPAR